jgi:hypothetical protein
MTLAMTQQAVMIHEFLHWMGIVGDDIKSATLPNGDTVTGEKQINQEVVSKCFPG